MKVAAQVNQMVLALDAWARALKGKATGAGDPFELIERLKESPGGFRAVVLPTGELKRGENEESSMVDRNFAVVLSRGKGLAADPGASKLKTTQASDTPLFDLVEQARDLLRGLSFDEETTEVTLDYKGWEPFPAPDGVRADAYQLNFTLGTLMPEPTLPAQPTP